MSKEQGLTLAEILVTIALIVIVAAIAFPTLINITGSTQQKADVVTSDSLERFNNQWNRAGYFVVEGTGENTGYTVAIWDENNDGVQQPTEKQVVGRIRNNKNLP